HVVVDGKELGPHDGLGTMSFSPDGTHLAYAARRGNRWSVVLDGRDGTPHLGLVPGGKILFDSPLEFHYLARRKRGELNEISLFEERIVRDSPQSPR
ncbi:MAG TPA: hypothetical protein VFX28_14135, partial [Methylomirabilota bacterium]|nr:hypothetical protein [Methylomirabilota bacterium]